MHKSVLNKRVQALSEKVAKEAGIEEDEARTLVGMSLRRRENEIVAEAKAAATPVAVATDAE